MARDLMRDVERMHMNMVHHRDAFAMFIEMAERYDFEAAGLLQLEATARLESAMDLFVVMCREKRALENG